jgi:hypothetical protein
MLACLGLLGAGCGGGPDGVDMEGGNVSAEQPTLNTVDIEPTVTDFDASNVPAGSRICLKAGADGKRARLVISNINVQGGTDTTLITNCYGKVEIEASPTTNLAYVMQIKNSRYFKLSGRGTGTPYGIEIDGQQNVSTPNNTGLTGLQVSSKSTNFEIESLAIHNVGFAGIMAKTDPGCAEDPEDANRFDLDFTQKISRDTFVQRDTRIHDNFIYDTARGEGLYIGHSFYSGQHINDSTKACDGWQLYPSVLKGVRISGNDVRNTGAEGIQLGSAEEDAEVYGNVVRLAGQRPFDTAPPGSAQDNGIQIGEGTTGKLYGNKVFGAKGHGIVLIGLGNNAVHDNLVVDTGESGLFADDRPDSDGIRGSLSSAEVAIFNNTFVNTNLTDTTKGGGLFVFPGFSFVLWNNLLVNPGTYNTYETDTTSRQGDPDAFIYRNGTVNVNLGAPANAATSGSNLFLRTVAEARFVNPTSNVDTANYDLQSTSPAVDSGADISARGVATDLGGRPRLSGSRYDVGAYEQVRCTGISVTGLTLINADTDQAIGPLTPGMVVNYAQLGTRHINLRADVNAAVGSVVFGFDANDHYRVESAAPYAIEGDTTGDYHPWTPTAGSHTVTATPYSASNGSGTAGCALTVSFTVQDP